MNEIIVVGNGKLADTIMERFPDFSSIPARRFEPGIETGKESVFVHVGSGRQYGESLKAAITCGGAYIQAATVKDVVMEPPVDKNIVYIHAANLDVHIIKFFYWLKLAGDLFKDDKISILESHQQEKTSQAGTAVKMAGFLGVPEAEIISIRDPEEQKKLKIRNPAHHAFHRITIGDEESGVCIETRVEGAVSYVRGLARIVECIPRLAIGNYEIDDLLALNLL